jgi:glucose-6-phosphate 1-dehydrogenase
MSVSNQVIIFGASGDLTARKLIPALASLALKGKPAGGFAVIGCARRPKSDEQWRGELRDAMPPELREAFEVLAPDIFYIATDVSSTQDVDSLAKKIDGLPGAGGGRLFYLSLKPELFGPTVDQLAAGGLLEMKAGEKTAWRRVIIEKPFGHDLESAIALNRKLHESLREDQVYRIDHYLGKETVQNLLGLRFHNAIFEPLWNSHHVELVQITVAEDLGMESGRGGYYDTTGALRDMMQNHMLQILAFIAMEPPSSMDAAAVRGQKISLLRCLRAPSPEDLGTNVIRAQYTAGEISGKAVPGYLQEEGIAPGSNTESFVAVRAEIDSWRWAGVPFLLRHGKRMSKKFTEVQVQFRMPPLQLFNRPDGLTDDEFRRQIRAGTLCQIRPNVLTLSIQPREAISLSFGVKTPGNSMVMAPTKMSFDYKDKFGASTAPAYERLLLDALTGDPTLFLHGDEIEASWKFADTIEAGFKAGTPPMAAYPAGSWGPESVDGLFHGCEGGWTRG